MSRRLTEAQKAQIIEQSIPESEKLCDGFIDSSDSTEFYEGMAAGIDLTAEILRIFHVDIKPAVAKTMIIAMARCIKETRK